jgi:hypothetical protein
MVVSEVVKAKEEKVVPGKQGKRKEKKENKSVNPYPFNLGLDTR